MFQVYNFHDVSDKIYESFSFTAKSDKDGQILVWEGGKNATITKTYNLTKNKKTITVTFEELGIKNYTRGISIQNRENTHKYEFNNFRLNRFKDVCDELCADGHLSECSGYEPKASSNYLKVGFLFVIALISLII